MQHGKGQPGQVKEAKPPLSTGAGDGGGSVALEDAEKRASCWHHTGDESNGDR